MLKIGGYRPRDDGHSPQKRPFLQADSGITGRDEHWPGRIALIVRKTPPEPVVDTPHMGDTMKFESATSSRLPRPDVLAF
jgi:hypothetical protein